MQKPTKLHLAEHQVVNYFDSPKEGTAFEDILKPEYWSHVAHQLRPGHKVEVLAEDASFWALLLVIDAGKMTAIVEPLLFKELASRDAVMEDEEMFVKYRGPHSRYSVLRKSDNAVMKENLQTKAAAAEWMKNRMLAA